MKRETIVRFIFPRARRGNTVRGPALEMEPDGHLLNGTPFQVFRWTGNSFRKYWGLSFDVEGEEILALPAEISPPTRPSKWPPQKDYCDTRSKLIEWAEAQPSLEAMGWESVHRLETDLCLKHR